MEWTTPCYVDCLLWVTYKKYFDHLPAKHLPTNFSCTVSKSNIEPLNYMLENYIHSTNREKLIKVTRECIKMCIIT